MKVLILIEWYYPIGGVEAFAWRLAKHLSPDIQVTFAIRFMGEKVALLSPAPNITIQDVTKYTFQSTQRLVAELKPDIIHTNHVSLIGIAGLQAARNHHIPLVITNHQVPEYQTVTWKKPLNSLIWEYLKFFDKRASSIVAPSPAVAALLSKHTIQKAVIVSCGVDTHIFHPQDKEKVRQKLGLANKTTFLFVGRIAQDKNLEVLLQAANILKNTIDFQVILVGPTHIHRGSETAIKTLIAQLHLEKHVIMPGALPPDSEQLSSYYGAADIFVLPSFFETQSIATLEAMASGLPVVASQSGALPDLIKNNVNGLLFTALDAADLATKLQSLLNYPLRMTEMGKQGRAMVEKHDIANTAYNYEQIYQNVLEK